MVMRMTNNICLAENLKKWRKKRGLSRRALAEKINYTDKAVEKWESGQSTPPLPVICQVADILDVRLEELIYDRRKTIRYFLGIDGGGTKTAFRLESADGVVLAESEGGASNPNDVGMQRCEEVLAAGMAEVTAGIDLREVAVYAGLAGGMSGDNAQRICRILSSMKCGWADCGSDVDNALELCLHGGDGVMVIAGTGSIAFAQNKGIRHRVGGWGYLLDGGGSGYDIGRDGLNAAFRALDGRGTATVLTELLEAQLHKSLPQAVPDIYSGGKRFIAALAPLVFEAADCGDRTAQDILAQNGAYIAELIRRGVSHLDDPAAPVVICGGLAHREERLRPYIEPHLEGEHPLSFNTRPIVTGAVMCARRLYEQHREA